MRPLLLSLAVLVAADAAACTCITFEPKTAFKGADTVFLGEVTGESDGLVLLRVVESFKGPADAEVAVDVGRGTTCDYPGQTAPGSRHLMYAWRNPNTGVLMAGMCSRSTPEANAGCDLRYLRSRAWWWRSPLSSLRILRRLGIQWDPCPGAAR